MMTRSQRTALTPVLSYDSVGVPPSVSTALRTPVVTESSSATSRTTVLSRPSPDPAFATVSSSPAWLMSAATTWPPSSRIRSTHACPMPEPPPVISTRRSVYRCSVMARVLLSPHRKNSPIEPSQGPDTVPIRLTDTA